MHVYPTRSKQACVVDNVRCWESSWSLPRTPVPQHHSLESPWRSTWKRVFGGVPFFASHDYLHSLTRAPIARRFSPPSWPPWSWEGIRTRLRSRLQTQLLAAQERKHTSSWFRLSCFFGRSCRKVGKWNAACIADGMSLNPCYYIFALPSWWVDVDDVFGMCKNWWKKEAAKNISKSDLCRLCPLAPQIWQQRPVPT